MGKCHFIQILQLIFVDNGNTAAETEKEEGMEAFLLHFRFCPYSASTART